MFLAFKRATLCLALAGGVALVGTGCPSRLSERDEVRLGQETAREVERQYRTLDDPIVDRVGRDLARVSLRPDLPWSFRVIDRPEVNAVSLPGGPIYIFRGLLQQIGQDEGALAGVVGHEIGHVERRHHARQIERAQWFGVGTGVVGQILGGDVGTVTRVAANLQMLSYSRQQEYEADDRAIVLMRATGRDPQGLVRLLELLQRQGDRGEALSWFRTHPTSQARIDRARQRIQEIQ
jgi:beta-barrel assembly-enhancing protease